MKLTHTLITTLWYAGQHAMAMPTPDDPVSALDQQSLLNQQCKNLDAINAPPVDFGGTQYITTGNPNAAAVGYTKPDPTKYQVDVYELRDILFKADALRLISGLRDQIPDDIINNPVPQGYSFNVPRERVSFKVTVTGDMNIIFFNLRQCLDALDAFYARETEVIVPFTQCAIHEDNYLQGRMDMTGRRITVEDCARTTILKI